MNCKTSNLKYGAFKLYAIWVKNLDFQFELIRHLGRVPGRPGSWGRSGLETGRRSWSRAECSTASTCKIKFSLWCGHGAIYSPPLTRISKGGGRRSGWTSRVCTRCACWPTADSTDTPAAWDTAAAFPRQLLYAVLQTIWQWETEKTERYIRY